MLCLGTLNESRVQTAYPGTAKINRDVPLGPSDDSPIAVCSDSRAGLETNGCRIRSVPTTACYLLIYGDELPVVVIKG